jgi:hypothetical protein
MQQVRALERQSSRNSNDLSMTSPAYQPFRVRQSSDFPNIIRLSRHESYHSQNSNAVANERYQLINHRLNQVNRESQGIRFDMNSSVSDQEIDNDD